MAAALALGACSWHEVKTESVSTETHQINGSGYAGSSDAMANTGASSSASGGGVVTRSRTMERDNVTKEWHVVQ
jgi:hypothetical protein